MCLLGRPLANKLPAEKGNLQPPHSCLASNQDDQSHRS